MWHYRESGRGRPLILLHGIGMSGSAWNGVTPHLTMSRGSWRMPADAAIGAIDDLACATGFEDTFASTASPFCGREIAVPVTVAFGTRDWILLKHSRRRDALPAHTRWMTMPGWGHVPMWADPVGVAQLILNGAQ